jgi:chaperonin cofactor prefoldin
MMNRIQKLQQKINTLPQQREKLAQSVDGLTAKINRQLSPAKPAQSN